MQKFIGVEYDHKPNEVEVYKSGVDVIIKCVETQEEDKETHATRTVWICDVDRYDLQEYVYVQQNNYNKMREEITQTQVGLAEVFEYVTSAQPSA